MADGMIEKTPTADVSVSKPASGTYGERTDLEELKSKLPPMGGGQPGPGQPGIGSAPGPGVLDGAPGRPSQGAPPGVPGVLMSPGAPGEPINPLAAPPQRPMAAAQSAADRRIVVLQTLASSDDVSPVTRAWAKAVLEAVT